MGFLDRLHKIATGVGGALQAPFGLVKDLASAPFTDDEYDGLIGSLYHYTVNRGGQLFGNLFGPNEGVGAAIGAMPENFPVRSGGRAVLGPALRQSENVYHGISTGISTAVYAGSLATGDRGFVQSVAGVPDLFRPATWQEAYRMASKNADPGQAVALAAITRDIRNPTEVAEAMNSDAYEVLSGTYDAVNRFFLDPLVLAGKTASGLRQGAVVRPLDTPEAVARLAGSEELRGFNRALQGQDASVIRDRWFSKGDYKSRGAEISDLLASAGNEVDRLNTLKALIGDRQALERVRAHRADIGGRLDRMTRSLSESEVIKDAARTQGYIFGADELADATIGGTNKAFVEYLRRRGYRMAKADDGTVSLVHKTVLERAMVDPVRTVVQMEIDALYPQAQRLARVEQATGYITRTPRVSEGAIRTGITRSDFWQASPFAKPVRVVTEMQPHRMVNLHEPAGDIQLKRFLDRSNLPLDRQDAYRSAYMHSVTPNERQLVLTRAENEVVESIARAHNMDVSDIRILLDGADSGRNATRTVLQSRSYDAKGRGTIRYTDEAGTATEIQVPIWATQEKNFHVLPDLDEVIAATTKVGQWKLRHPNSAIPTEVLDNFYRVWKPAVLLRFGWPIRVVGDEQLRILAKIGALAHAKSLARTLPGDVADQVTNVSRWAKEKLHVSQGPRQGPLVRERTAFTANGYEMQGAFGAPGDMQNLYRDLVSSSSSYKALVGPTEENILGSLRTASGQWRTVAPWDPEYASAWEWAVTNQIAQDTMARMFLRGATPEEVARWLTSDPKGMEYAARNPVRAKKPLSWARTAHAQVHDYLPTPELRELARRRKVTAADLVREVPDANLRPAVHGEILMQTLGKGHVTQVLNGVTNAASELLGRLPTDVLSRNAYFDHVYRAEATRLVNLLDDGQLTPQRLRSIEASARHYALDLNKELLYDLAEKSRLGAMLRHIVPFYGAWQEVITRWSGLAVENPAFVARMRQVWQAPEKAGLLTDENGREIEWGVEYAEGERGKDRYLTIPLPEWARDIPGLRTQGEVAFNRKSFNLALQGAPGFGPPVQIAVNEVVKNRPDLESSLDFVLPFGSTQELKDLLLPATAKRAWAASQGEEDRAFFNTEMRIYWDKVVDYNLGKRPTKPTWEEANKEAQALFKVRTAASWFSPASPTFRSPYQVYIDAYRQARERYAQDPKVFGGRSPDDWFYDTYGAEFFPLTQSLSKSADGVPPTLEGYTARGKYKDLIERHPELGGLIVGAEGAGKFSGAVYDAQFANKVGPGSASTQRFSPSFEDASTAPNVRLGWLQYSRIADLVDAELVQRGLSSINVKGATDVRQARQAAIAALAQQYPEWYDDFQMADEGKWRKRIDGMEEIAGDDRLAQRAEIQGLRTYLDLRKLLVSELLQRKNTTLTAQSNSDLAYAWEVAVNTLVERNLAFGDLYHRWLENDPVVPTLAEKMKAA